MTIALGWIVAFFRFWYHFLVGDDWTIAAIVVVTLVLTFLVSRSGITAWWLVPAAAIFALALSLWRARRTA